MGEDQRKSKDGYKEFARVLEGFQGGSGPAPESGPDRWVQGFGGTGKPAEQQTETRSVVCKTEGTLITKYTNSKTQVIRLVVLKESLETPQSPPVSFKPASLA